MKKFVFICNALVFLCVFNFLNCHSQGKDIFVQSDTVYINEVQTLPAFDGIGNDPCWQNTGWHPINQVWMPYGTKVDCNDYYGRFKVVWSPLTNLLYFFLEVNDDTISDAYIPGQTADIFNFDMFEVFIDENRSGEYHVFDGTANDEASLGTNAENAFAYHIFAKFPGDGQTTEQFLVNDLTGTSWADAKVCNYREHFPNMVLRHMGNVACWEFSLKVYNNTYSESNKEGARVILQPSKIMGLSLAYSDDDHPQTDPKFSKRDAFIGSVAVPETANNDHWKNADGFGVAKLVAEEEKEDHKLLIQSEYDSVTEQWKTWYIDKEARFKGGDINKFIVYIMKNLKFPDDLAEACVVGKVKVQFTINDKGKPENIIILRSLHPLLDKEVKDLISDSPKWRPASFNGVSVKQNFTISINFSLS